MMFAILILSAALVGVDGYCAKDCSEDPAAQRFCYKMGTSVYPADAFNKCDRFGCQMVSINNKSDYDTFITYYKCMGPTVWLPYKYNSTTGQWNHYLTGQPIGYIAWSTGNPDAGSSAIYMEIWSGALDDISPVNQPTITANWICICNMCGPFPDPNLVASKQWALPQTNVTFSCATGYTLNGMRNLTCLDGGKWSVSDGPSCSAASASSSSTATIPNSTSSGPSPTPSTTPTTSHTFASQSASATSENQTASNTSTIRTTSATSAAAKTASTTTTSATSTYPNTSTSTSPATSTTSNVPTTSTTSTIPTTSTTSTTTTTSTTSTTPTSSTSSTTPKASSTLTNPNDVVSLTFTSTTGLKPTTLVAATSCNGSKFTTYGLPRSIRSVVACLASVAVITACLGATLLYAYKRAKSVRQKNKISQRQGTRTDTALLPPVLF